MNRLQRAVNVGLIVFCGSIGVTGCASDGESDSGATPTPTPTPTAQSALIDATAGGPSATGPYTYFSLSTGQVVNLTDTEAATSTDWDIAFKRTNVKLNGGVSGPKGVGGYSVGNNSDAYDSAGDPVLAWFQAATSDSELPDFDAVTATQIPSAGSFEADVLDVAIPSDGSSGSWWSDAGGSVAAVPGNWWVIKSAAGNTYIKTHITDISEDSVGGVTHITLEWLYQASGEATFNDNTAGDASAFVVDVPLAGGTTFLDFDAQATGIDPTVLTGWDMKFSYDATVDTYALALNGGASGSGNARAFGPTDDPDAFTTGVSGFAPGQIPIYFADSAGGVLLSSPWYEYNLTGTDNKLWPNYRVYLIDTGSEVYKLQILSYYHPQATTSAWYSIRYEKVSP